jgi:hypothetical protein
MTKVLFGQINVKEAPYSATGNGTTDDTAAIVAAIAAKDAAGGGTIFFPKGTYKLTSAIDMGTKQCTFLGEATNEGSTQGSLLNFTGATDGLVFSATNTTSSIRHLHIQGSATVNGGTGLMQANGSGTGIKCTGTSIVLFVEDVIIWEFNVGFNPGNMEDGSIRDTRIYSCVTGLVCNGVPNDCKYYNLKLQNNNQAAIISQGAGNVFYGGIVQANHSGILLQPALGVGGIVGWYFDGVWFEGQGSTHNVESDAGPDVVFDTTNGPIENITLDRCRMAADTINLQFSGNGANTLTKLHCRDCIGSMTATVPAWVVNPLFDFNSSSTASTDPIYINVKAPPYNAVGDGITDDTAAIQAALDAAKNSLQGVPGITFGGMEHSVEVYLPNGNYLISAQLDMFDWISLKGDFHTALVAANNNIPILCFAAYQNRIENITFTGGKYHLKAYGYSAHYGSNLGGPSNEAPNWISHCNFQYANGPSFYIDTTPFTSTTITSGSNGVSLPTSTIHVTDSSTFPVYSGVLLVTTNAGVQTVSYTGNTGSSFTGCTGGTGTMSTGGSVAMKGSYAPGRQESSATFHFTHCEGAGACFFYGCSDGVFYDQCHMEFDWASGPVHSPVHGDDGYLLGVFNTGDHLSIDHFVGVPGSTDGYQAGWIHGTGSIKCNDMRFGGESLCPLVIHRKILPFNGMPLHIGWGYGEIFLDQCEMDTAGDFDWLRIYDQFPNAIVARTGTAGGLGQFNSTFGIWVDGYTLPISSLVTLDSNTYNIIFEGSVTLNGHRIYTSPFPLPVGGGFPDDPVGFTDLNPVLRRLINSPYVPPTIREARNNIFPEQLADIAGTWTIGGVGVTTGSADTSTGYSITTLTSVQDGGYITFADTTSWGTGISAGEYTFSWYIKATFGVRPFMAIDSGAGFATQTNQSVLDVSVGGWQRIAWTFYHDGTAKKFGISMYDWPNGGQVVIGLPMINKGANVAPYLFPVNNAVTPTVNNTVEDVVHTNYYGTAAPTSGNYKLGDIVWNTAPASAGPIGWVCTTASPTTPTFKAFGTIS